MEQVKIISGTEPALMEKAKKEYIRRVLEQAGGDCAQEEWSNCGEKECIHMLESLSLFHSCNLYIVTNPLFFPVRKNSAGGEEKAAVKPKKLSAEQERLAEMLLHMKPDMYILFYIEGTLQVGTPFYKQLKGKISAENFAAVTSKNVMPYVQEYVEQHGKQLDMESQHYLAEVFYSWESISLPFIYTELDRLFLMMADAEKKIGMRQVRSLFRGYGNNSVFSFVDMYLQRTSLEWRRDIESFWDTPAKQIKNIGYLASQLRVLKGYLELRAARISEADIMSRLTGLTNSKNMRYLIMRLKRYAAKWTEREIDIFLEELFRLQLKQRQGSGGADDILMLMYMMHEKGKR